MTVVIQDWEGRGKCEGVVRGGERSIPSHDSWGEGSVVSH